MSFIAIQSLCEHMLNQIFTDITTQDTHTDSTTHLYQKWFIKTSKSHAVLNPRLSPIESCCSVEVVQLREAVACHCHGNVDVASWMTQSDSPTAPGTPVLPGTKSHAEKD